MKKALWLSAGVICLSLFFAAPKTDLGSLRPVRLVQATSSGPMVHLWTDTGLYGEGVDFSAAIQDLRNTAPGQVYLETADYLLVTPVTVKLLPELRQVLRPGTEVALIASIVDGEKAAEFLSAHPGGVPLRSAREHTVLPRLITKGERYVLEE